MRKIIAVSLLGILISGCKSEIDHAETRERNGLTYKYGDTDPFSGVVKNTPMGLPGLTALCNIAMNKGRPDGNSECFYQGTKVYEVEFKSGKIDGSELIFDYKTGKLKQEKNWKEGRQDGIEEKYLDGVLISHTEYKDAKKDGKNTSWTNNGKEIISDLTWKDGKEHDGFVTTMEGRFSYLDGQLNGKQVRYGYYINQARYTKGEENYKNGRLDGVQRYFLNPLHTEIVKPESEIIYDNGVAISGWFREYGSQNYELLQEYKLVQSPKRNSDDFRSKYPGNLVPDGLVKESSGYGSESEALWANGIIIKKADFRTPSTFFVIAEINPHEKYRQVTKSEYASFGPSSLLNLSESSKEDSPLLESENCVNERIADFHEELGEDAMISRDQLGEWEEECNQGESP